MKLKKLDEKEMGDRTEKIRRYIEEEGWEEEKSEIYGNYKRIEMKYAK